VIINTKVAGKLATDAKKCKLIEKKTSAEG